ncbi:MAG: hypothetical protein NT133_01110 [Alphaproteobacteria bacterium]|nr:hypothetical protein [Alphaproteobacteria bacterium]
MTYQSRNPLAATSPLRSVPLYRPAALVFGYSEADNAAWELSRAREMLPMIEARFAGACKALGETNRMKGKKAAMRRFWQAEAFEKINAARKQLRQARARVVAAELAMVAIATVRA